jgi:stage III sporulation protein AB
MIIFCQLYEFNEQLLLNLKYDKNKISQVAAKYKYVEELLDGKQLLSGEDEQFIQNYVAHLGKTDAQSQIDYLNQRQEELKKYKSESADEYKKYSSLYLKVSLMTGILIAVLLA